MADEVKVQDAMQSDFSVVVNDIAEELLTRLNMDEGWFCYRHVPNRFF